MILFIYGWVAILALAIVINVLKQGYDERLAAFEKTEKEVTGSLREFSRDSYEQALLLDSAIKQLQKHCDIKDPIQLNPKLNWSWDAWREK